MIIFRYLSQQILSSFLATTMVLLVIFLSNQLVHNLNDAASGSVTVHAVLTVTAVQLPIVLAYMLPIGLFLGTLVTLGRLYVDHEMVVLSACGVSKTQIVNMILMLALPITAIDAWLTLSAQPYLAQVRSEIIAQSAQTATLDKILPGRFQKIGDNNHVIYAGAVDKSEHYFGDVFVAIRGESTDQQGFVWNLLSSDQVREERQPNNGQFFVFENGERYWGIAGENDFKRLNFKQFWQRLPTMNGSSGTRYSTMNTHQLLEHYASDSRAAAELQWRIVNVLSTLLFALLAIPLSRVNPRKGKFAQMLPAILLYVAYANTMFASKSWIKSGKLNPSLGMWWIPVALLLLALLLLWFEHGWNRLKRLLRGRRAYS